MINALSADQDSNYFSYAHFHNPFFPIHIAEVSHQNHYYFIWWNTVSMVIIINLDFEVSD